MTQCQGSRRKYTTLRFFVSTVIEDTLRAATTASTSRFRVRAICSKVKLEEDGFTTVRLNLLPPESLGICLLVSKEYPRSRL